MPSEILENISLYCAISLANFRLLFSLIANYYRSSIARGSGTSVLSRWSLQKLTSKFEGFFFAWPLIFLVGKSYAK